MANRWRNYEVTNTSDINNEPQVTSKQDFLVVLHDRTYLVSGAQWTTYFMKRAARIFCLRNKHSME